MKLEAKQRLKAGRYSSSTAGDYEDDAMTAAQGKTAVASEIKQGWVDAEDVKEWTIKSVSRHLYQTIGASPEYAQAYVEEACKHFKLPVPKK